jgi:polyisoprenyl-phosphate glycosyltransferase
LLNTEIATKINSLRGPILVLGAGGFIGGQLFRELLGRRSDVYGTWRKESGFLSHRLHCDLRKDAQAVIEMVKPVTIFDCVAYGGYLAQTDVPRIYETNLTLKTKLLELASKYSCDYIHGGSSSEYGEILDAPTEGSALRPNTHYAVSKGAAAGLIHLYGKHRGLRCCNLRLYAVYGLGEREEDRLIPQVINCAKRGLYPPFVRPDITRDFIHVEDVCEAYVTAALHLQSDLYGESFNIGTGVATSIRELATLAKEVFDVPGEPKFDVIPPREFDFPGRWCANPRKALTHLRWQAKISLREGLERAKGN